MKKKGVKQGGYRSASGSMIKVDQKSDSLRLELCLRLTPDHDPSFPFRVVVNDSFPTLNTFSNHL